MLSIVGKIVAIPLETVAPLPTTPEELLASGAFYLQFAIGVAIFLIYATLLESSPMRATLGKRLLQIEVTDNDGNQLSLGRALARNLLKAVQLYSCLGIFLFLVVAFTPDKRGIHDMVAGACVNRR